MGRAEEIIGSLVKLNGATHIALPKSKGSQLTEAGRVRTKIEMRRPLVAMNNSMRDENREAFAGLLSQPEVTCPLPRQAGPQVHFPDTSLHPSLLRGPQEAQLIAAIAQFVGMLVNRLDDVAGSFPGTLAHRMIAAAMSADFS